MNFWKDQFKAEIRYKAVGTRPRDDNKSKVDLTFADMELAWMVLAGGLAVSAMGFCVEITYKLISEWISKLFTKGRKTNLKMIFRRQK